MSDDQVPRAIHNREELELFFADLVGNPQGVYRGVDFIVWDRLVASLLRSKEAYTEPEGAKFVIVGLPRRHSADLLLESRSTPSSDAGDDRLVEYFSWSATNDKIVRAAISGKFLDTLVEMAKTHKKVVVTDDWVGFGPLHQSPTATASTVDDLISTVSSDAELPGSAQRLHGWNLDGALPVPAVLRPKAEHVLSAGSIAWSTGDSALRIAVPESDQDESPAQSGKELPFCYYCGASLTGTVSKCSECGQSLDDD